MVDGTRVDMRYAGVNGAASLAFTLRFRPAYFVLEHLVYTPAAVESIVRPAAGGAARAPGVAESGCRAAIASLTGAGIRESTALAIVPFDSGRVTIARHGRAHPIAGTHLFGGATLPLEAIAASDTVAVAGITNAPDGTPVEWIEIRF